MTKELPPITAHFVRVLGVASARHESLLMNSLCSKVPWASSDLRRGPRLSSWGWVQQAMQQKTVG